MSVRCTLADIVVSGVGSRGAMSCLLIVGIGF